MNEACPVAIAVVTIKVSSYVMKFLHPVAPDLQMSYSDLIHT